jgi:lysophospholipase L1-like esterase
VTALVFYDENGNGVLDANEAVRLPQVEVVVGSVSARSATGGQAVVSGVHAGSQTVAVRTESVPAYFVPPSPTAVQVPQAGGEIRLGMRLPIGDNEPNLYLAFGDSITVGEGANDGGYVPRLQNRLRGALGRGDVLQQGKTGTYSKVGADRIPGRTGMLNRPAYTLILYGTNDWNDQTCQPRPPADCFTIDSLRTIVETVKDFDGIPVLATLPPTNPAVTPAGRNQWNDDMNGLIKALARAEGAILADVNAAFRAKGSLPALFADDVHPNAAGYDVIADAFFQAITGPRSATAASRSPFLLFAAPARN